MADAEDDALTSNNAIQDHPEDGRIEGVAEPEEEDGLYVVEEILAKRTRNNTVEYKVKWEGYGISDATWQTSDDLTNCSAVMEQFEARHKEEKREKRRKALSQPTMTTENDIPSESGSSMPTEAKIPNQSSDSGSTVPQNFEATKKALNAYAFQVENGHGYTPSADKKLSVTQKRKRQSGLAESNEEPPVSQIRLNETINYSQKKVQSEKRQKIQVIPIFNSNNERQPPPSSPEITAVSAEHSEPAKVMTPITLSVRKESSLNSTPSTAPATSFESPALVAALQRSKHRTSRNESLVNQMIYEFTDEERNILELRRLAPKVITCLGMVKNGGEDFPRVVVGFSGDNGSANFSKAFPLSVVREILPTKLLDFYESCIRFE